MNKKYVFLAVIAIAMVITILVMYERSPQQNAQTTPMQSQPSQSSLATAGKVIETMNAGGYTYVHVDTGREKMWAAGPETVIAVGDNVNFDPGMQMTNFRSDALNRTFEEIYFVEELRTGERASQLPPGHPPVTASGWDTEGMDFSGIAVPAGGKSVADVYAGRTELEGKKVIVRGKVVKFTADVMDKNWIHLMDGTGTQGSNDLAVTTTAVVEVGDVVVVEGKVALDKDFGFGYVYEIIVEDARVTVD